MPFMQYENAVNQRIALSPVPACHQITIARTIKESAPLLLPGGRMPDRCRPEGPAPRAAAGRQVV